MFFLFFFWDFIFLRFHLFLGSDIIWLWHYLDSDIILHWHWLCYEIFWFHFFWDFIFLRFHFFGGSDIIWLWHYLDSDIIWHWQWLYSEIFWFHFFEILFFGISFFWDFIFFFEILSFLRFHFFLEISFFFWDFIFFEISFFWYFLSWKKIKETDKNVNKRIYCSLSKQWLIHQQLLSYCIATSKTYKKFDFNAKSSKILFKKLILGQFEH